MVVAAARPGFFVNYLGRETDIVDELAALAETAQREGLVGVQWRTVLAVAEITDLRAKLALANERLPAPGAREDEARSLTRSAATSPTMVSSATSNPHLRGAIGHDPHQPRRTRPRTSR